MWYVLIVSVLNILLGLGLAVLLGRRCERLRSEASGDASETRHYGLREPQPVSNSPRHGVGASVYRDSRVFSSWQPLLHDSPTHHVVLAAMEVLSHQCTETHGRLAELERSLASFGERPPTKLLAEVRGGLVERLNLLLIRCLEVTEVFEIHDYQLEKLSETAESFEATVSRAALALEENLKHLEGATSADSIQKQAASIQSRFQEVVRICHTLRDQTHEAWVAAVDTQGTTTIPLGKLRLDLNPRIDQVMGVLGTLQAWRHDDPSGLRLASLVAFDLDGTRALNEQWGLAKTDALIRQVGACLNESVRQNRGLDRVFWIGGQRFLAFLGDTGPKNGASAAERLKALISEMELTTEYGDLRLTCSTAATAIDKDSSLTDLLQRLNEGLMVAKAAGANQSAIASKTNVTLAQVKTSGKPEELTAVG